MLKRTLVSKWTPWGFALRVRRYVRHPSEIQLALAIGYFICRLPRQLRKQHLRQFLAGSRACRRRAGGDLQASKERVARLRDAWLALPWLQARNTCYVRALTLYRFLEAGPQPVAIHFGVERCADSRQRLRGHAWVTVSERLLEGPDAVLSGGIVEIPIAPAPQ
jgi:hypothetical protein